MRLACDTGGTFTDLLVEADNGLLTMFKSPTTPEDPIEGVISAIRLAARNGNSDLRTFLGGVTAIIHGTTHAINAVIMGRVARTAFLTTKGHPDILVLREGGRSDPFGHEQAFPDPYIPRALTLEIPERINYAGDVVAALDEAAATEMIKALRSEKIEAVACCLLWSISNPAHELAIGRLLGQHLPGVPYTLSHQLNPSLREYRRGISTAIDASLKPLMTRYLGSLRQRLMEEGFGGRLLVQTSQGGMADAEALARTPIHSLNSGPALAPVAGRYIAGLMGDASDVIVADTGGTTYDVSLIRNGRIPMTRETWIGRPYEGFMTGFPSVDVKSVGAGGGSIAWLDGSGLMRVGPASAGARPGPACFGHGGHKPTVTDAAVILGYIDPDFFLGGAMALDVAAARRAMATVAGPLKIGIEAAALAIFRIATENMVQAILDITVRQGIDPAETLLIGGGGAAGLNSVFIGRRLGCAKVLIPAVGACLSAAGALLSEIRSSYRRTLFSTAGAFSYAAVNDCLQELAVQCREFAAAAGATPPETRTEFSVEARYPNQVWEIDVPFDFDHFKNEGDVQRLCENFHDMHQAVFGFSEKGSDVEFVTWAAAVSCQVKETAVTTLRLKPGERCRKIHSRPVWFEGHETPVDTPVYDFHGLKSGPPQAGPALVETRFTTVVIDPDAHFNFDESAGLIIYPGDIPRASI